MSIRDILQEPAVDGVVHLAIALGVIVYCLVGFRRAGHRLRYGIILPIGVVLLFGAVLRLAGAARVPWLDVVGGVIALLVFLGLCLGYLVLTVFLLVNGVTIMRKEGRRPATLLSFAAGAWMVLLPALPVVLAATGALRRDVVLVVFAAIYSVVFAATAYVAFFFLGFLISAVGYRKLARRFAPDAIIVLGAGLKGEEPTPLLAGRLDRGLEVYHRETARGRAPVMIPSGGQGPDEVIAEGEAMRRYLADRGVPASTCARRPARPPPWRTSCSPGSCWTTPPDPWWSPRATTTCIGPRCSCGKPGCAGAWWARARPGTTSPRRSCGSTRRCW